jgi:hypothetical protein
MVKEVAGKEFPVKVKNARGTASNDTYICSILWEERQGLLPGLCCGNRS